jgi:amidase
MAPLRNTATRERDAHAETDLAFAGVAAQLQMLRSGAVSSTELVTLSLKRITDAQPQLNCFRVVLEEQALAEALAADRRLRAGGAGALLGMPIAIKDDVDLAGEPTPFGCASGFPAATESSELVRRLRAAGAIIIGKTNAPEVGQWHFTESRKFGVTRNPWHLDHTPGGSSGGAAAAVAAGLVPAAIGSDGAGSIRIPAAWTNLVGLKPQRGRISTWPEAEPFNGLTCFGPLTRSVYDCALLLDSLAGNHDEDLDAPPPCGHGFSAAATMPTRRLRIAVSFATPFGVRARIDPAIRHAIEQLGAHLQGLGHEVFDADPRYGLIGLSLVPRGTAGVHGWIEAHSATRADLEPRTRAHDRLGRALRGLPLTAARAAERPLARRIGRIFEDADLVLTPTTATPPPRIGELDDRGYWQTSNVASEACPFAWPWNVLGWPGISLPAGFTDAGLPIGAQLLGPRNGEATLLALGAELETAAEGAWTDSIPPFEDVLRTDRG